MRKRGTTKDAKDTKIIRYNEGGAAGKIEALFHALAFKPIVALPVIHFVFFVSFVVPSSLVPSDGRLHYERDFCATCRTEPFATGIDADMTQGLGND
jgi:hypothetical protein